MSDFIEDFYYGNIEPQECTTKLTAKVKKSLSELSEKEEKLISLLTGKEKELFKQPTSNFQASATQTVSPLDSNSVQDSHTTPLSKTGKDKNYGKYYIQTG